MTRPTPRAADLLLWADRLLGQWSALQAQQRQADSLYFQHFSFPTTGEQAPIHSGSVPADVDAAVDALVPTSLFVRIPPARRYKTYLARAERLARAARGLLRCWRLPRDPFALLAYDQVLHGLAVARVLYEPQLAGWTPAPPPRPAPPAPDAAPPDADAAEAALATWELTHRPRLPLVLQRRDPRTVAWQLDEWDRLLLVVERYPVPVLHARTAYAHLPRAQALLRGLPPDATVTLTDVWYGAYRALFLNQQPLYPGSGVLPHGYPELPYVFAPFRELPYEEPDRRYRTLLSNTAELYPLESQVLTMWAWMLAANTWTTYIGWTRDARDIVIRPQRVIHIDRRLGEYLEPLPAPTPPQELVQSLLVLQNYLHRNTAAPPSVESARSAQQVWALQAAQERRLLPARLALQRLAAGAVRLAFRLVREVLQEPLTIPLAERDEQGAWLGEVRIGPDDVDSTIEHLEVLFGPRLDPAQLEQWKTLAALAHNGWLPLRRSWELGAATETPSDWWDELMLENVERLPFLRQLAGYELLRQVFGEEDWRTALYREQLAREEAGRQAAERGPGIPAPGGLTPPAPRGAPGAPPPGPPLLRQTSRPRGGRLRGHQGPPPDGTMA